jgi:hypothetical protein
MWIKYLNDKVGFNKRNTVKFVGYIALLTHFLQLNPFEVKQSLKISLKFNNKSLKWRFPAKINNFENFNFDFENQHVIYVLKHISTWGFRDKDFQHRSRRIVALGRMKSFPFLLFSYTLNPAIEFRRFFPKAHKEEKSTR